MIIKEYMRALEIGAQLCVLILVIAETFILPRLWSMPLIVIIVVAILICQPCMKSIVLSSDRRLTRKFLKEISEKIQGECGPKRPHLLEQSELKRGKSLIRKRQYLGTYESP